MAETQSYLLDGDSLLSPFNGLEEEDWTFTLAPSPVEGMITVEEGGVVSYPSKLPAFAQALDAALVEAARALSEVEAPSPAAEFAEERARLASPAEEAERSPSVEEEPMPLTPPTPGGYESDAREWSPEVRAEDRAPERSPSIPSTPATPCSDSRKRSRSARSASAEPPTKAARAATPAVAESSSDDDSSSEDEEAPTAPQARADSEGAQTPPAPSAPPAVAESSSDEDSSSEDEEPAAPQARAFGAQTTPAPKAPPAVAESSSDEEEEERAEGAQAAPKAAPKAQESSEDESSSSDDEAPKRWTAAAAPKKAPGRKIVSTKAPVRKENVEKWIAESDHRALRANARNARGDPRSLYVTSKIKLGALKGLSPLRFAICQVFRASKSGRPVEASLETLRALMTECGASAEYTEPREELLLLLASKAPTAYPDARCDGQVLEVMLATDRAFLGGSASVGEAAACFAANGRKGLLSALLRARGDVLSKADLFEVLTQTLVSGRREVVVSALRLVGERALCTGATHPKTGSTLLHFAAKRDDGRFVEEVLPYCNAWALDHKGRAALYYLERTDAPAERIALLRAAP